MVIAKHSFLAVIIPNYRTAVQRELLGVARQQELFQTQWISLQPQTG